MRLPTAFQVYSSLGIKLWNPKFNAQKGINHFQTLLHSLMSRASTDHGTMSTLTSLVEWIVGLGISKVFNLVCHQWLVLEQSGFSSLYAY